MHNQHSSFPSTWKGRQKEVLVFLPAHKANTEKTRSTFKLRVTYEQAGTQEESFEWMGSHWRPQQQGGAAPGGSAGHQIGAAFQTIDVYSLPRKDTPSTEHSGCLSKGCTEAMEGVSWWRYDTSSLSDYGKNTIPHPSPQTAPHTLFRGLCSSASSWAKFKRSFLEHLAEAHRGSKIKQL